MGERGEGVNRGTGEDGGRQDIIRIEQNPLHYGIVNTNKTQYFLQVTRNNKIYH